MQKELRRIIIGQDAAIEALSVSHWTNTQRRRSKKYGKSPKHYPPKANLFFAAPSGSGKTFTLTTFAEVCEVPFAYFDASKLTADGYIGSKVSDIFDTLLANANGNVEVAKRGIIHLDEVDKLKVTGREGDVGGIAAQNTLLTALEGAKVMLDRRRYFDPSDVTIVATGACVGLERRGVEPWINEEDMINYGFDRQFLARFSVRAWMNTLGENELRRILLESEASVVKQMINQFRDWKGVDLEFKESAIDAMVRLAIQKGNGARSLNEIAQTYLGHVKALLPGKAPGVKSYIVDAETVLEGKPPKKIRGVSSYTPLDLSTIEEEEYGTPPVSPPIEKSAPPPNPSPPPPDEPPTRQPTGLKPPDLSQPTPSRKREKQILGALSGVLLVVALLIYLLSGSGKPREELREEYRSQDVSGLETPALYKRLREGNQ
jgi:ATP-dependent Clp protease ATP-binding subunit ClpX